MKIKSIHFLCFLTLIVACTPPTQLTKTWTDPSVNPSTFQAFKKVLVIARLKDETGDRIAEDKIAAQFKRSKAVQSYTYLNPSDKDQKVVDAKLLKDGFDGVVTMKLTEVEKSLDVHTDNYGYGYGPYGYGGFYGSPYGGVTTVSENHSYTVETCIYSLSNGKLLWSGTTSSFNPGSLESMLDQIIAAIKEHLTKQGLMQP